MKYSKKYLLVLIIFLDCFNLNSSKNIKEKKNTIKNNILKWYSSLYSLKITFFLIFLFTIFSSNKSFSAQIKIEAFGMDKYFNYDVEKGRQFLTYSNEGLFMTDIGINGVVECKGIIEVITGTTSSNIMCKYTEGNGDMFYAQFFVQRGSISEDATVQSFEFVSGTGRWAEMIGQKCIGAYTPMQQKRFMWQGKCEMSDKTLERVKNYKKPN